MKTYSETEMREKQGQLDAMRDARDVYRDILIDIYKIIKPEPGQNITTRVKELLKERDEWHTKATNLIAEKMKDKK